MSKTLTDIRDKVDELIGEKIYTGTTSDDGADTVYLTAVDASLARYPDAYFKDWYLYTKEAAEERKIETFLSPSGTLTVWEGFTARVAASKAYTLSKFTIAEKLAAINRALVDSYPYFYNRITGVLIGEHTDEKDDREYLLTDIIGDTFSEIPQQLYVHECYYGTHTGDDDASTLTDSSKSWDTSELVGHVVYNKTDSSYGTITANTATTVTATLANGTGDDWDTSDEYIIPKNLIPERLLNYAVITGDLTKFYADVTDKKLILCVGQSPLTTLVVTRAGAASATTASHLIDATKSQFVAADVGRKVFNWTDTTTATITAYTSTSDVTLDTDIMASGEYYTIDATTELNTDEEAEIIALKSAANLYKMEASRVDSNSAPKYKEQAYQWEMEFLHRIKRKCMSPLIDKIGIDWSWA